MAMRWVSILGLGLALKQIGKQVQMVLQDGVPIRFRPLPGASEVRYRPEGKFDLIIVLDCSELARAGNVLQAYGDPDINIDHHITNTNFAILNWVDSQAVSTTEMLALLIPRLGLTLTQPIATVLLAGLITDSLGLRTQNMTARALRVAADLVETDVNLAYLYDLMLGQRSYQALQYWAAGLSLLARDADIVWATLTLADRERIGYPGRDDADLVNVLSSIGDCQIAIIFVEQVHQRVKISWRARSDFDTSQVALLFWWWRSPCGFWCRSRWGARGRTKLLCYKLHASFLK